MADLTSFSYAVRTGLFSGTSRINNIEAQVKHLTEAVPVIVTDTRFAGGAKGDGVANDGVASNLALTVAGTGATVLPTATYLVSALAPLVYSKVYGYGSTLKPSANSITVVTLKGGSGLQSSDFALFKDLLIDGSAKTGVTGFGTDVASGGGAIASLILENLYVTSADTFAFDLTGAQFIRTYNLRASNGTGTGMLIKNLAGSGGGNSHDHYGLHSSNKEVGVVVNGTNFSGGCHGINFYNPQIVANSVCGMAFFAANAAVYGSAPESNASGASTTVVDGQTVKKSSMYLNNSTVRGIAYQVAEGSADPCFLIENSSTLTLEDVSGYGSSTGTLVQADATSVVELRGMFACQGVVQNVSAWPDTWILPATAKSVLYGTPMLVEDTSTPTVFAERAPTLTTTGTNLPTLSFVEDTDLGYCSQSVHGATLGDASANNRVYVTLGSAAASQDSVLTCLIKSSVDCTLGVNLHDGAAFDAINASNITLKAGKVTRIVMGKRNIASGSWAWVFYPNDTSAPTFKISRVQLYQGTTGTAVSTREVSRIMQTGAFNPGVLRETAANLALKAQAVNIAGKFPGKQVWDTTNNRVVFSAGRTDVSVWKDGVNTTVYTPI